MECPQCHFTNPPGLTRCVKCSTDFGSSGKSPLRGAAQTPSIPLPTEAGATSAVTSVATLKPRTVLGERYEILELLGEGAMGAVYKAKDRVVDRFVALKVIRPELSFRPEVLQRFKQELILARQVTHKNVIRIFDLGEADGIKFISMDYIEGRDLKSLIREKGKFPPEDAKKIVVQVCRALNAAHSEGVVHRDLKPQNILVGSQGHVTVMDFGIARSKEMPGLTQTGMVVGTPEYMAPEQCKGENVDGRSDLYALGIIFYELLTGETPHHADTALAIMMKRTQERPRPPNELDPSIPPVMNKIVVKCLEIDPSVRYQNSREILQDLEERTSTREAVAVPQITWRNVVTAHPRWAIAAVATTVLLVLGLYIFRGRTVPGPAASAKSVTLLVADFENKTSDPVFDSTLEPMMEVALEGASFINAYKRAAAQKIASDVQPGAGRLGESEARLVAVREGIQVVVAGSISHPGNDYVVSVKAVDPNAGKTLVKEEANAKNKNDVLGVVGKLAAGIRKALRDTTPESAQIAAAETFTSASLEAAHEYAVAQNDQWAGKWDEATQHYLKAVQLDPDMGRAYSGLGVVAYNTGHLQAADKYFKDALARIDRMSEREKYRTRGTYYVIVGNAEKAVEELSQLVKQYPADTAGLANLAAAYLYRHDMARAVEVGRRAVEVNPKSVPQRNNGALYALFAGDFEEAIKELQQVLQMNPSFVKAYSGMALSQLSQGHVADAEATYRKLESVSPRGASAAAAGLADVALYQGRVNDAISILDKGAAADLANKSPDAAGLKLVTMAHAQSLAGHAAQARATVEKALAASKETSILFWAARDDLDLGDDSKALALAKELGAQLGADQQAYAKLIEGEAELKRGKPQDAIRIFKEAQKISDTWLGHFDLGRGYIEAGAFAEADSEIETCLKRRGEATAAFLDVAPTFSLLPPVYYYLGRAQEGLKSARAAQSYKQFLAIKAKGEDPLVADTRRRLAALEAPAGVN